MVTYDEIVRTIDAVFPIEPVAQRGSQPAERFACRDGGGEVGVIASVTRAFCSSCDRVRLTADGQFRNCLFPVRETDLRAILRGGAPTATCGRAARSARSRSCGPSAA